MRACGDGDIWRTGKALATEDTEPDRARPEEFDSGEVSALNLRNFEKYEYKRNHRQEQCDLLSAPA